MCFEYEAALAVRQTLLARTGSTAHAEGLQHVIAECPVHDDMRPACPAFREPRLDWLIDPDNMAIVVSHEAQS
jgi:hypothetical protein